MLGLLGSVLGVVRLAGCVAWRQGRDGGVAAARVAESSGRPISPVPVLLRLDACAAGERPWAREDCSEAVFADVMAETPKPPVEGRAEIAPRERGGDPDAPRRSAWLGR